MENYGESGSRVSLMKKGIKGGFKEIKTNLENENFFQISSDSNRVFNLDETRFMLNAKKEIVLIK